MEKPIQIPVGNECEIRILPKLVDGTSVPAATLTDIVVKMTTAHTTTEYSHTIDTERICVALPANQVAGEYDVHISAKLGGRKVAMHRRSLFARCLFDNGIALESYNTDFIIIGSTDDELDVLKEALASAIEEYNEAKADYEAKAALKNVATETTQQQILTKVNQGVSVDLSPVTNMLKDADGNNVLKDADGSSMLAKIWSGVNGMFNKLVDFIKVAPTKTEVSAVGGKVDGVDTKIGGITDSTQKLTIFGRISYLLSYLSNITNSIGTSTDAATSSTIFGKLANIFNYFDQTLGQGDNLHAKVDSANEELTDEEHGLAKISQELGKLGTPKEGAEYTTLFGAIEANQGGGGTDSGVSLLVQKFRENGVDVPEDANLQTLYNHLNNCTILVADGTSFVGNSVGNLGDAIIDGKSTLKSLYYAGTKSISLNGQTDYTNLKSIDAPNASGLALSRGTYSYFYVTLISAPSASSVSIGVCYIVKKMNALNANTLTCGELSKLHDLTWGKNFNSNKSCPWAFERSKTSSNYVEEGEDFANDWERWDWCMRNHFAANLPDRSAIVAEGGSAYTITFASGVVADMSEETQSAFTSRGWAIA